MTTDKRIGMGLALIAVIVGLTLAVLHGTQSPDCEALYNEYMNTSSVTQQGVLFERGMDNGCFHYN